MPAQCLASWSSLPLHLPGDKLLDLLAIFCFSNFLEVEQDLTSMSLLGISITEMSWNKKKTTFLIKGRTTVQDIRHAWNGKLSQRQLGHWTGVTKEFQSIVRWILQHQHCLWLWADWQPDSFSSPEAESLENEGIDKREGDKPIYKWGVCRWQY